MVGHPDAQRCSTKLNTFCLKKYTDWDNSDDLLINSVQNVYGRRTCMIYTCAHAKPAPKRYDTATTARCFTATNNGEASHVGPFSPSLSYTRKTGHNLDDNIYHGMGKQFLCHVFSDGGRAPSIISLYRIACSISR